MLQALWATAPVMVSIVSFCSFVWRGGEVTVGVAFTVSAEPRGAFRILIRSLRFLKKISPGNCVVWDDKVRPLLLKWVHLY